MVPDRIKIGWKEYVIQKDEPKQTLFIDGKECYGTIDYDNQVITLSNRNNTAQDEVTLIHEVLHGIDNMHALGLGENTIERLADAIYTVLLSNGLEITKSHS